jgi:hypothetical protein
MYPQGRHVSLFLRSNDSGGGRVEQPTSCARPVPEAPNPRAVSLPVRLVGPPRRPKRRRAILRRSQTYSSDAPTRPD